MRQTDSVQVFSDKYLQNISDAFRTLYTEEQLSDITIHCKEGSIKAHKLILAASSPYFYKIFRESRNDYPIVILYGIALNQLKYLMDLLYQGIVDIPNADVEAMCSLVKEFEIKGVVFGRLESNNVRLELNQTECSESVHGRDTRYKGQKRVAVDFIYDEEKSQPRSISSLSVHSCEAKPLRKMNQEDSSLSSQIMVKREVISPVPNSTNNVTPASEGKIGSVSGTQKLNAWARKQRKFKCDLCPSSFKRSSHLSRHQLVHTGERPYSCNQCEKAFSRHDKLKHHIRKAHEFIPDSMFERIDVEETNEGSESDSINRNYSSIQNGDVSSKPATSNTDYMSTSIQNSFERENSPLFTISHITSILEDSFVTPPKKGRGRPRKYPPAPPQPFKRGRGRPRLHQVTYAAPRTGLQNYDITNLPYGDLNYLTSQSNHRSVDEATMLEPLVEINTCQGDTTGNVANNQVTVKVERNNTRTGEGTTYMEQAVIEPLVQIRTQNRNMEMADQSLKSQDNVNISEIETKIGLIGECTISVAN